jgi:hypothetical protein
MRFIVTNNKQHFIEANAKKWGDDAAAYLWNIRQLRVSLLPGVALVWFDLVVRPKSRIGLVLAGAFCLMTFPQVALIFLFGGRANQAASRALGVRIGWSAENSPPRKAGAYEAWCKRKGLVPYGASEQLGELSPTRKMAG